MNDKGHLFILCEKNKKGERVPEKSLVLIGGLKAISKLRKKCEALLISAHLIQPYGQHIS